VAKLTRLLLPSLDSSRSSNGGRGRPAFKLTNSPKRALSPPATRRHVITVRGCLGQAFFISRFRLFRRHPFNKTTRTILLKYTRVVLFSSSFFFFFFSRSVHTTHTRRAKLLKNKTSQPPPAPGTAATIGPAQFRVFRFGVFGVVRRISIGTSVSRRGVRALSNDQRYHNAARPPRGTDRQIQNNAL